MIHELSYRIADFFVQHGEEENDRAVLAYGAECSLNFLISESLLLLVGVFTGHVLEFLVWSVSFMLLRTNVGGLHAASHFWCATIGTLIGASSALVSPLLLQNPLFSFVLVLISASVAVIIAPVPHKNKKHIQKERKVIKRKVALIAIAECVIIFILYFFLRELSSYIATGMIFATLLAVAGVFFNPK